MSASGSDPYEFWNGEAWVEWNPSLRSKEISQSPDAYEVFNQALFSESHPVSTGILKSNFTRFINELTDNQLEESFRHLSLCINENPSSFSTKDCVVLIQKILDNRNRRLINFSKETELVVLGHLIGLTRSKKWKIPVSKLLSHFSVDLVGPFLLDKLGYETEEVAVKTLMRAIGKLGYTDAEHTVSMFLNSENPVLRKNAIRTLTILQSSEYHIEISKRLDDDIVFVQKEAINSLRELKIASSVGQLRKYRSRTEDNDEECDLALATLKDLPSIMSVKKTVQSESFSQQYVDIYWDVLFDSMGENSLELLPLLFGHKLRVTKITEILKHIKNTVDQGSWRAYTVKMKQYCGRGEIFDRTVRRIFPELTE